MVEWIVDRDVIVRVQGVDFDLNVGGNVVVVVGLADVVYARLLQGWRGGLASLPW